MWPHPPAGIRLHHWLTTGKRSPELQKSNRKRLELCVQEHVKVRVICVVAGRYHKRDGAFEWNARVAPPPLPLVPYTWQRNMRCAQLENKKRHLMYNGNARPIRPVSESPYGQPVQLEMTAGTIIQAVKNNNFAAPRPDASMAPVVR